MESIQFLSVQKKIFQNKKTTKKVIIIILILIIYLILSINNNNKNLNSINHLYNINDNINNNNYGKKIILEYQRRQNDFCNYPNKYFNKDFERQIRISNFSLDGLSYNFYIYKNNDLVGEKIISEGSYEGSAISNILIALKYYGKKNICLI